MNDIPPGIDGPGGGPPVNPRIDAPVTNLNTGGGKKEPEVKDTSGQADGAGQGEPAPGATELANDVSASMTRGEDPSDILKDVADAGTELPEDLRKQIEAEVADYRENYRPTENPAGFYNNLNAWLVPTTDGRAPAVSGPMMRPFWEMPISATGAVAGSSEAGGRVFSQQYVDATPAQHFAAIQSTISELGMSVDEIKRLAALRQSGSLEQKQQYADYILPLYTRLRENGYTRDDLIT